MGGTFTHLGTSRAALFTSQHRGWHAPAISATGVRAVHTSGNYLYLAGDFTAIAGQPRQGMARFTVDLTGNATLDSDWRPTVMGTVTTMVSDDAHLFIGGTFSSVGDQPRHNLARISIADGTPGTWTSDTDGAVNALALSGKDLVAGGAFLTVNGASHVRLALIDSTTGVAAESFSGAADSDVRALVIKDDKLIVGGQFAHINSEDRGALARLELASGDVDPKWRCDVDGAVLALSATTNQHLFVGGTFNSIASQSRTNCARVTLSNGAVDPWTVDTNERITAISETNDGQVFLGGHFTRVNDAPALSLVRVSAETGAVDATWRAPGLLPNTDISGIAIRDSLLAVAGEAIDGPARSGMAFISDQGAIIPWRVVLSGSQDRALCSVVHEKYRYIGGYFSRFANQPRSNLARITVTTGELDLTWHCDANGPVRAMTILNNELVIGGDFTTLGAQPRGYLAKVSLADATVLPWDMPADGPILAMTTVGSSLLVTGSFQHLGGLNRLGVGRFNQDGSVDPTFAADLTNATSPGIGHALAVLPSQQILVGGRFTSVNGKPVGNCALLDPNTGALQPWQAIADGPVFSIAVHQNQIVMGGGFTSISGDPRARLAMVAATTGNVTPWRVDADLEVRTLVVRGDTLWVGGDFTSLNQQSAYHLGRCTLSDGTVLPCTAANGRVELLTP